MRSCLVERQVEAEEQEQIYVDKVVNCIVRMCYEAERTRIMCASNVQYMVQVIIVKNSTDELYSLQ